MKVRIKKGDTVRVISGNDKGHEGKVLDIDLVKYRVTVEGANMISRHTKPNSQFPDGGIIKREGGIHLSNVLLVDGKGYATRVGSILDEKTGKKARTSKKNNGEIIN